MELYVHETYCSMTVFSTSWILDSGASAHICCMNQDLMRERKLYNDEVKIRVGSGQSFTATAIGSTSLFLNSGHVLLLDNVLVLPNGLKNIVSIPILVKNGYTFHFIDERCNIYYGNKFVGFASLINGLYYLSVQNEYAVNTI